MENGGGADKFMGKAMDEWQTIENSENRKIIAKFAINHHLVGVLLFVINEFCIQLL